MNNEEIIVIVDKSMDELINIYRKAPTLFYTESDLANYLCMIIIKELNNLKVKDIIGKEHTLVHREYPTPFKCNMKELDFKPEADDSSYRRGHYDIVVLNPEFIRNNTYDNIKAQDFKDFKMKFGGEYNYPVLYGIEFAFSRGPLKNTINGKVETFIKQVKQDEKKIVESQNRKFIKKIKSLVFVIEEDNTVRTRIKDSCGKDNILYGW